LAAVVASESDLESLLQTSSIKRHLLQNELTDEQLVATVRQHLEARAASADTIRHFEAAVKDKKKEKGCHKDAVQEITQCLALGNGDHGMFHLVDALAGTMDLEQITTSLADMDCATGKNDWKCFQRSECWDVTMNMFDVNLTVGDATIHPTTECEPLKTDDGTFTNDTVQGWACGHTPKSACDQYKASVVGGEVCAADAAPSCDVLNEVDSLNVNVCEVEESGSDHFIRTYEGCKEAVKMYGEANTASLQTHWDGVAEAGGWWRKPKVSVRFGGKSRSKNRPEGCWIQTSRRGKVRGYFTHKGSSWEASKSRKADNKLGRQTLQTLCKSYPQ